jgi:hypothetical protein
MDTCGLERVERFRINLNEKNFASQKNTLTSSLAQRCRAVGTYGSGNDALANHSADSLRSPSSPAPPGDQIHSACPLLHWPPSRSAPPALDPWPASWAARSPCGHHHRQQSPHMFRIKSSPDHQAPAILQPDFDPFPQPLLPPIEMRPAQLPLSTERRHTLPTPHLFGNQPAPLRPRISVLLFSLRHGATLLCGDHLPQDAVHVALTVQECPYWNRQAKTNLSNLISISF